MKDSFDAWMKKVDAEVSAAAGLGALDLPDVDFYSMWEDEYTPREAARAVVEEAADEMGFPGLADELF